MTDIPERLSAALSGRYRIERELGVGGMATVYLAEDVKHDRKVAVKVLKPELAAMLGGERFVVEIKTTASLNHPHILPLFDSGNADGFLFYVMPFIEGETIREKLNRETQFGVDDAVRVAREVADALDYAHRSGVIHRDIKPENILLHDGRAMVMDFGIALALSAAAGGRMTETGLSLGTPHYMSPEQATAEKEITPRSDIYSLASVLYEMLSGQPPHLGGSAQQIIMKIIAEPVAPVTAHRKSVPPNVVAALGKALEKIPADRFESAKAFGDALTNPAFRTTGTDSWAGGANAGKSGVSKRVFIATAAVAVVAIALLALSAREMFAPKPIPPALSRFTIQIPESVTVGSLGGTKFALSPDGKLLVFVGSDAARKFSLYLRRLDDTIATKVRGTEDAVSPTFSPDGRFLLFLASDAGNNSRPTSLRVVPVTGGVPEKLADSVRTAGWGAGANVVTVLDEGSLWIVSSEGGERRRVVRPDSARGIAQFGHLEVLPGGTHALITYWRHRSNSLDSARLGAISLSDGSITDLGVAGSNPRYAAPGYIIFGRSSQELYVAPFSLRTRTLTAAPALLLEDVAVGSGGAAMFAISQNGTLVYLNGRNVSSSNTREIFVVDRHGAERPVTKEPGDYWWPRVSPDGRRVAVTVGGNGDGGSIWIYDIASGSGTPLTADSGFARPEWSRDGARVVYVQSVGDSDLVLSRPWDLSTPPQVLARAARYSYYDLSLGKPGGLSVIRRGASNRPNTIKTDILLAPTDSLGAVRPLFKSDAPMLGPRVSPDGKLVAYSSNESGRRTEIYVTPIPGPGARVKVSLDGGVEPMWSKTGNILFYRRLAPLGGRATSVGSMLSATIGDAPALAVTRRDSLFADFGHLGQSHANYDVFPNGEFLMMRSPSVVGGAAPPKQVVFAIVNWQQLIGKRVAGGAP